MFNPLPKIKAKDLRWVHQPDSSNNEWRLDAAEVITPYDLARPDTSTPLASELPEVGDILSNCKGTGARFNNNKTPYEYLPLDLLLNWLDNEAHVPSWEKIDTPREILRSLAAWHAGDDAALDHCLDFALEGNFTLQGFGGAAEVFKYVTTRKIKPYPLWNWKKGQPWLVPYGCAVRHTLSETEGKEFDDDPDTGTGKRHRDHTICNLVMLLEYRNSYLGGDNRPPKVE